MSMPPSNAANGETAHEEKMQQEGEEGGVGKVATDPVDGGEREIDITKAATDAPTHAARRRLSDSALFLHAFITQITVHASTSRQRVHVRRRNAIDTARAMDGGEPLIQFKVDQRVYAEEVCAIE